MKSLVPFQAIISSRHRLRLRFTAKTGNNTYVLDGKEENNNQYIGTISQDGNTDGIFKVTVNISKASNFHLPAAAVSGSSFWQVRLPWQQDVATIL